METGAGLKNPAFLFAGELSDYSEFSDSGRKKNCQNIPTILAILNFLKIRAITNPEIVRIF